MVDLWGVAWTTRYISMHTGGAGKLTRYRRQPVQATRRSKLYGYMLWGVGVNTLLPSGLNSYSVTSSRTMFTKTSNPLHPRDDRPWDSVVGNQLMDS